MRPRGRKNTFADMTEEPDHTAQPGIEQQFTRPRGFFDVSDAAQVKYEMLRYVASGHSIDEALHAFGFSSRQTFYRAQASFEQSGLAGLVSDKPAKAKSGTADDAVPHARLQSIERSLERMKEELQEFRHARVTALSLPVWRRENSRRQRRTLLGLSDTAPGSGSA